MLTLSEEELDWLSGQIPDAERSPKGGRPPTDKRQVIAGVFWVLDNGTANGRTFLPVLVLRARFTAGFSSGLMPVFSSP